MSRILEKIKIDIDTNVFFDVDWPKYRASCIQHQIIEQKDLHPNKRMPKSLVLDNTAIHQKFFEMPFESFYCQGCSHENQKKLNNGELLDFQISIFSI